MTPSFAANAYRCLKRQHNGPECTGRAWLVMDKGDAFVIGKFVERYRTEVGQLSDEPDGSEDPEAAELHRAVAHAEDALQTLVDDPLSLAALTSAKRAEVLRNAQDEVEHARASLDERLKARHTSLSAVLNAYDIDDLFEAASGVANGVGRRNGSRIPESEPSGSIFALSIPETRRLLGAGIERIEVSRGSRGDYENRVNIVWREG
jgi:hypothetical protein